MIMQSKNDAAVLATDTNILFQTLIANRVVSDSGSEANSYEIRNERLIEQAKEKIRYKNGITLPTSAKALILDSKKESKTFPDSCKKRRKQYWND